MEKDKKKRTLLGKVKRAAASVKQMDMFGQSVNFSVDGEEKTTSWLGAMVSIVIVSLLLDLHRPNLERSEEGRTLNFQATSTLVHKKKTSLMSKKMASR